MCIDGRVWKWVVTGSLVVLVALLSSAAELEAQHDGVPLHLRPDMNGVWRNVTPRWDCGDLKDINGEPRIQCSVPVAELPMNTRVRAWLEFVDEALSPKYDCVGASVPNILMDPQPWEWELQSDRVVLTYEKDTVVRIVWMDGRSHPPPTEVFNHGHSIGHWEDQSLVVETTNFMFDPDGIDDMAHIPSSPRKVVIERYTLENDDRLTIQITIEDELFFTAPFSYEIARERQDQPIGVQWCDPVTGRMPLDILPQKYPD